MEPAALRARNKFCTLAYAHSGLSTAIAQLTTVVVVVVVVVMVVVVAVVVVAVVVVVVIVDVVGTHVPHKFRHMSVRVGPERGEEQSWAANCAHGEGSGTPLHVGAGGVLVVAVVAVVVAVGVTAGVVGTQHSTGHSATTSVPNVGCVQSPGWYWAHTVGSCPPISHGRSSAAYVAATAAARASNVKALITLAGRPEAGLRAGVLAGRRAAWPAPRGPTVDTKHKHAASLSPVDTQRRSCMARSVRARCMSQPRPCAHQHRWATPRCAVVKTANPASSPYQRFRIVTERSRLWP